MLATRRFFCSRVPAPLISLHSLQEPGWMIFRRALHAAKAAPRRMKMIPLHWREGVKELRERLEHVPLQRGGLQGVAGNPHAVLIQQWLPPSSPPLAKGGRSETNELLQGLTNFFTPSGVQGRVVPDQ